jgi:glycine betaine/proline transport system ATP-binding protein
MAVVEFRNVDIVFGARAKEALKLLDAGRNREEILTQTGCVLGAAGANLAIERGEVCVLMGLSGSGKSTLLRAVNRLNEVSRGEVLVDHDGAPVEVSRCDQATLRQVRSRSVAMVFQQFGLLPWRTVADNVGFGLELRGGTALERNRVVEEKLALVGLTAWAQKYTHELSGGMQQRVGLARAFATDAPILLMDEPFSALDPLIRTKLQDELLTLQRKLQKTIIFVSHDLEEAVKIGSRIAIMEGGRIVQCGTPEEIVLTPATPYVAEFVAHINPLSVLRSGSLMTPLSSLRRDGDTVSDEGGRMRLGLDAGGRPQSATVDGRPARIAPIGNGAGPPDPASYDVAVAPIDTMLQAAIRLRRDSGNPVVLVDQLGRMAGLCGDEEIYRALLRDRRDAAGHA